MQAEDLDVFILFFGYTNCGSWEGSLGRSSLQPEHGFGQFLPPAGCDCSLMNSKEFLESGRKIGFLETPICSQKPKEEKKKKIRCGAMGKPVNFKEPSGWEIKADGGSKTENEVFITDE